MFIIWYSLIELKVRWESSCRARRLVDQLEELHIDVFICFPNQAEVSLMKG